MESFGGPNLPCVVRVGILVGQVLPDPIRTGLSVRSGS